MGQLEILNYLKQQYKKVPKKWFTATEIMHGLKENGATPGAIKRTHVCLMRLATFKLIRFKGLGVWKHTKVFQHKR